MKSHFLFSVHVRQNLAHCYTMLIKTVTVLSVDICKIRHTMKSVCRLVNFSSFLTDFLHAKLLLLQKHN